MRGTHLIIAAALALLAACTEVRVYAGRDDVEVHKSIGITEIRLAPTRNPAFVETRGAGLVTGEGHLALGWMTEQLALFPDPGRCAVMIVAKSPDDVKAVDALLKRDNRDLGNVCVTGSQDHDDSTE